MGRSLLGFLALGRDELQVVVPDTLKRPKTGALDSDQRAFASASCHMVDLGAAWGPNVDSDQAQFSIAPTNLCTLQ